MRAQDTSDGIVAVLPLAATNAKMALYSKPVADAVAKQLRKQLKVRIEALSLSGAVPTRVSLVVDGRIVMTDKKTVVLEARVRDPERGKVFVTLATKPRRRTAIDLLARELAAKLKPRLTSAFAEQRRLRRLAAQARRRAAAAAAARKREARRPKPVKPTTKLANARPVDRRPIMLVMEATGQPIAHDNVVPRVVTSALHRMTTNLGYRWFPGGHRGIVDPLVVRNALRAHNGSYALMVDVPRIKFDWHRVLLSARAKLRVVLVDRNGKAVFAKTLHTGTIVGSRGDGYAAMVHSIGNQLVYIFQPKLKRVIQAVKK